MGGEREGKVRNEKKLEGCQYIHRIMYTMHKLYSTSKVVWVVKISHYLPRIW